LVSNEICYLALYWSIAELHMEKDHTKQASSSNMNEIDRTTLKFCLFVTLLQGKNKK